MRRMLFGGLAVTGLALCCGAVSARLLADLAACHVASWSSQVASTWLAPAAPLSHAAPAPALPTEIEDLPDLAPESLAAAAAHRRAKGASVKAATPKRGILVRRARTRAAVHSGIRPQAVPVMATALRPAGLLVTGWGAAGTGFRDGDVIVQVNGSVPRSVDDVIGAVAAAYRKKVYAVSGRIWRDGELYNAVVELPEPTGGAAERDEGSARPKPRAAR